MNDQISQNVERFKSFLTSWMDGYKFAAFSYVALKKPGNDIPVIVAAAVRLLPLLDQSNLRLFTCETSSIIGGFTVWPLDRPFAEFLSPLREGIVASPNGPVLRMSDQGLTAQFDPGDSALETNQPRQATLKILAVGLNALLQDSSRIEELNCELRAHSIPFDGIGDLLTSVYLDPNERRQNSDFSIVATNLVAVDRVTSVISQGVAHIHCLATPKLNAEEIRIGVIPFIRQFSERKSVSGTNLSWEVRDDGIAHGSIDMDIGNSQAVQVFLSKNDMLYDRYWIFDPEKHINPSYAVHQTIDNEMTTLRSFLSGQSKNPGEDLERGAALLLSLFRFSVAHYGLIPTLRDGPDLLAFTQANELLVVDCTTGLPNESNKVSKLISRTERIRASLQSSGHSHIDVLPVIVTTAPRATIQRDITDAASHGVAVVARENIDNLLQRVRIPPSPSQLFAEAKALINSP